MSQFSNLSSFCDLELRSGAISEGVEETNRPRNQSLIIGETAIEVVILQSVVILSTEVLNVEYISLMRKQHVFKIEVTPVNIKSFSGNIRILPDPSLISRANSN